MMMMMGLKPLTTPTPLGVAEIHATQVQVLSIMVFALALWALLALLAMEAMDDGDHLVLPEERPEQRTASHGFVTAVESYEEEMQR